MRPHRASTHPSGAHPGTDVKTRGALLDVDGTLLDSNDAHAAAYGEAFAELGIDVAFTRVRPLIGMGSEKLLPALGVQPGSRVGEHVGRRKKEIFTQRFLPTLKPFHGARDLLLHMKKRGLRLTVATSAEGDELHGLLRAARIEDLVDAASTSSDAAASKPDPDIVQAAIRRSRLKREELVMLGDTPYDVQAAVRAGVAILAMRTGGWSDRELAGAAAVYEDPADLLERYDESLLAARR
ncbi:MAG TPA: HAD family hydrolase [Polyangiaceae bacterium]